MRYNIFHENSSVKLVSNIYSCLFTGNTTHQKLIHVKRSNILYTRKYVVFVCWLSEFPIKNVRENGKHGK